MLCLLAGGIRLPLHGFLNRSTHESHGLWSHAFTARLERGSSRCQRWTATVLRLSFSTVCRWRVWRMNQVQLDVPAGWLFQPFSQTTCHSWFLFPLSTEPLHCQPSSITWPAPASYSSASSSCRSWSYPSKYNWVNPNVKPQCTFRPESEIRRWLSLLIMW